MGIDTRVKGTPADVYALADWLKALDDVFFETARTGWAVIGGGTESTAPTRFRGDAGQAYFVVAERLGESQQVVQSMLSACESKVRTYGIKLTMLEEKFEACRRDAREGGLVVNGATIEAPPAAREVPGVSVSGERGLAEYRNDMAHRRAELEKIALYNRLREHVHRETAELVRWTVDELAPTVQSARERQAIEDLGATVIGLGVEEATGAMANRWERVAREFEAAAEQPEPRRMHDPDLERWRALQEEYRSGNRIAVPGARVLRTLSRVIGPVMVAADVIHGDEDSTALADIFPGGGWLYEQVVPEHARAVADDRIDTVFDHLDQLTNKGRWATDAPLP
ncbi:hypothetical protein ACPYO6_01385 [Georgenia sp. Z1344]|uniref:hypothetical protein n=1 Tax=Georgenia sp. Z1344 TaxID=3416706 RepID=UPI003CE6E15B